MNSIPLSHIVIFTFFIFSIGLYGALVRRNVIGILMGIELMINAANVNLVAFSRSVSAAPEAGQIFAIFVIVLAACAAAVGLAIVLAIYRNRKSIQAEDISLLKW